MLKVLSDGSLVNVTSSFAVDVLLVVYFVEVVVKLSVSSVLTVTLFCSGVTLKGVVEVIDDLMYGVEVSVECSLVDVDEFSAGCPVVDKDDISKECSDVDLFALSLGWSDGLTVEVDDG